MFEKTAEQSLHERMAGITGARQVKVASTIPAHPETETAEAVQKLASMSLDEAMKMPSVSAGFNARIAERMPEIDAALDRLLEIE